MKYADLTADGGRTMSSIHIGGIHVSRQPSIVRTVLGSCISVCLRDPVAKVGGMNHFMLPGSLEGDRRCARYGLQAMELLINACMKEGADPRRLEAKVFGGGHVVKMRESDGNVPQSNIRFALEFLQTEAIPIAARDLGGYVAREILFFTDTGRTLLKRLETGTSQAETYLQAIEREERGLLHIFNQQGTEAPNDSNVTLF